MNFPLSGNALLMLEIAASLLLGASAPLLPAIGRRWSNAWARVRRHIQIVVTIHVCIFGALFVVMWTAWSLGNTDYYKVAAPMLLLNMIAAIGYASIFCASLVRGRLGRHSGERAHQAVGPSPNYANFSGAT